MKLIYAIFIALALPCLLLSQGEISKSIPAGPANTLFLNFHWGDVDIVAYDGKAIQIDGKVLVNGRPRADLFTIDSNPNGSKISIEVDADMEDIEKVLTIVNEDGTKTYKRDGANLYNYNLPKGGSIDKAYFGTDIDATFVVKVPRALKLQVESTYGNVTINEYFTGLDIHNTYGSVDAVLPNIPSNPDLKIKSTYNTVDVAIPANTKAGLSLKTGYGSVFTDLDFTPDKKRDSKNCPQGENITAILNNGSGSLKLESGYSNVYLRKTK